MMLDTAWQKSMRAAMRENHRMKAAGYRETEVDWELNRGSLMGHRIIDVQISRDGKHVWFKTAPVRSGE
jgi:hypothetical protein